MNRCRLFNFSLFIVLNLHNFNTDACSCHPDHPQELFCRASFSALVLVTDIESDGPYPENWFIYSVNIIRQFKSNSTCTTPLKSLRLRSIHICDVELKKDKIYLITGEHLENDVVTISPCGFHEELSKVTQQQLEGFGGEYDCDCSGYVCHQVLWFPLEDCEYLYSFCARVDANSHNQSSGGNIAGRGNERSYLNDSDPKPSCGWNKNPEYLKCVEKRNKKTESL
ncbi:tissue inhibitor of metalloproteinase-like [Brevipalpus obovatus]|uniref:tissue inhibitor of metalloproteinase-like n=1 Tax=Brevipalpus obovatus TaxID=246614 RepID=UPI003D9E69C6